MATSSIKPLFSWAMRSLESVIFSGRFHNTDDNRNTSNDQNEYYSTSQCQFH